MVPVSDPYRQLAPRNDLMAADPGIRVPIRKLYVKVKRGE
jgi:hypothetical protein